MKSAGELKLLSGGNAGNEQFVLFEYIADEKTRPSQMFIYTRMKYFTWLRDNTIPVIDNYI